MDVSVQHSEETSSYELGATIEGTFVPFVTVPAATVEGRIASAKVAEATAAETRSAGGASTATGAADDYNPADFTDNGDGTYTRKSDGVQGRFGPSGFAAVTTP